MPFKSEKHRRFMFSQHPEIAKRWAKKYGSVVEENKYKRTLRKRNAI